MAPRLKPIADEKELAAVPLTEPVLVELEPPATGAEPEDGDKPALKVVERDEPTDGAAKLEKQLLASQEAERLSNERAATAERERDAARQETERVRATSADTEKELLTNSLAGAQAAQAAAEAAFEKAFEAGDPKAMAAANAQIARAATDIRQFEGAVAQFDVDAQTEKDAPRQQEQTQRLPIETIIDRDPNLVPKERDWLKAHTEVLTDPATNAELTVAYNRALKAGHKRGTDAYFQFLDKFLGYAANAGDGAADDNNADTGADIVAAPVARDSRSLSTGRPTTPTRIMLTPEQRDLARSMGLTDVQYARGKVQLDANKKADPERFAGR